MSHSTFGFYDQAFLANLNRGFEPHGATFDGSSSYLYRYEAISGVSNNQEITASFWVTFNGGDDIEQNITSSYEKSLTSTDWTIQRLATNQIRIFARDIYENNILNVNTNSELKTTNGRTHVCMRFHMGNYTYANIYFNGVSQPLTPVTFSTSVNVKWKAGGTGDNPRFRFGLHRNGGGLFNGKLEEFWWTNTYLFGNVVSKFSNGTNPIYLGDNGELPMGGTKPLIYLSRVGNGSLFGNDSSSRNNNFAVSGILT